MQWLLVDDHKVKTRRDVRQCRIKPRQLTPAMNPS